MRVLAVVLSFTLVAVAAPSIGRHGGGHFFDAKDDGFPSKKDVQTLLGEINTTLSSGNPALDAARQEVVQGLFDAHNAFEKLLGDGKAAHDTAQRSLDNLKIAQGGVDNIEKAIETNATVNLADQLNVAKGLFLANVTLAALPSTPDIATDVSAAQSALNEAIAGGLAVLAQQGVDLAALETQVLGGVVDPADVAAQATTGSLRKGPLRYIIACQGTHLRGCQERSQESDLDDALYYHALTPSRVGVHDPGTSPPS